MHQASADVMLYALGWTCGWLLLCRPFGGPSGRASVEPAPSPGRGTASSAPGAGGASVAVIIPARDEASSIGFALDALGADVGRSRGEVVVVDDASTDATAALARDRGARVVSAGPLPPGWTGKNHACVVGVNATTAPVLVFVDADVRLGSMAVDALYPQDDTLVSIQPWHDTAPGRERLSVIPNLLAIMGAGTWSIAGGHVQATAAFGPVLAMTRAGYARIGGHAAVRGEPLEDVAFAHRFGRVELYTGRAWASFRMHPDGWRQQLEGWTRLLLPGLVTTHPVVALACVAWVASLIGGAAVTPWCYGVSALQVWVLGRRVGRFGPLTALLYPLSVALLVVAMLRGFRRQVVWRGRTLPAPQTRAHGSTAAR